jgi:hypothetical protein
MSSYRVPTGDGEVLAVPPWSRIGEMVQANRALLAQTAIADWREQARAEVLAAAHAYLHAVGQPLPAEATAAAQSAGSLLVSGHQPELFHPGVWAKNFALAGLARACGAVPLNLIVDNDTIKSVALRLPVWADGMDPRQVVLHAERFDQWTGETPYENRAVADEGLFASLPERLTPLLAGWPYVPMLPSVWAEMVGLRGRQPLLGERFAYARRQVERAWGCLNWELPLSWLCRTHTFARFAARLLTDAPRLVQVYNTVVREYRQRHRIRSRHHPVPDLLVDADWCEVPFWGQRDGQSQRGRLLVRVRADRLELRVGADVWPTLPLHATADALRAMQEAGFAVRTRALTTTLLVRLLIGDCFIHGIGGAQYDQLTDELCRRYFHLEPPGFAVVTATLRLPLPRYSATAADWLSQHRRQRELYWNPQEALAQSPDPAIQALVRRKQALIAQRPQTRRGRRARFAELARITAQLRTAVADLLQTSGQALDRLAAQLHANSLLSRRDFACWLHPEPSLRSFCTRLQRQAEGLDQQA